ncbi:hypothetical protein LZ31DRAFT_570138 [Colletotrichum somersetense]|nr:hypothetical protein LZ31DRAFT_570138 [Colletotrichum somersetense]
MPYTCDLEGCGRSYLRKEHLTRHKKEHATTFSFSCPSCETKFSRGDTLRRHMILHGPSVPPTRVAQACIPCHRTKTRCNGQQPVCSTCSGKSKSCEWPQSRGKSSSRSPSGSSTTLETTPNLVTLPDTLTATMLLADLPMQTILPSTISTIDFSNPESQQFLSEPMILQSHRIYFERFHPQWPLLHRGLYETTTQPSLLVRAVVTIGLWFDGLSQSKDLSTRLHDHLLIETGNELLDLLEQSKQGLLSPSTYLLPVFQATLIAMILVPYRSDKSMENIMITHAMLLEIFKATGVYDQSKINAGSRLCGHSSYIWVFRELYQR